MTDEEFAEYKSLTTESLRVNERKVLKVGTSNSHENMPMDNEIPMGGNMSMEDEMDVDSNMENGNGGSEFDTNFDAGVEADEDEDPKKYIQQLTGKLSQELGKYNNELGEPDIELSKYVGGMIVKQVAKNLDDNGKKDLIKKIKTSDSNENFENSNLNVTDEQNLDDENIEMPIESYNLSKKNIKQLCEMFVDDEKDEKNLDINKNIKIGKIYKPFTSPKFKK